METDQQAGAVVVQHIVTAEQSAALHYQNADPQAVELQGWIQQDGVKSALLRATSLSADEPCVSAIVAEYERMAQ